MLCVIKIVVDMIRQRFSVAVIVSYLLYCHIVSVPMRQNIIIEVNLVVYDV